MGVEPVKEPLRRDGRFIALHVFDQATRDPVTSFDVLLVKGGMSIFQDAVVFHRTVKAAAGLYEVEIKEGGIYRLTVRTSRHRVWRKESFRIPFLKDRTEIEVPLDPGQSIRGRVVDSSTGLPVPGALVGGEETDLEALAFGFMECGIHASTSIDGSFVLSGLSPSWKWIAAVHPAYAQEPLSSAGAKEGPVLLKLRREGARIYGTIRDDRGSPARGVVVTIHRDGPSMDRVVLSDKKGFYRTPPLKPGTFKLTAAAPRPDLRESHLVFTRETVDVLLGSEDVRVDFGPSSDSVTWKGFVHDPTGLPTKGVLIHYSLLSDAADSRTGHGKSIATCGEKGRFDIPKLRPGAYSVEVEIPPCQVFQVCGTAAFERPGVFERDIELDCGAIRGTVTFGDSEQPVPDGSYVTAMSLKEGRPHDYESSTETRDGVFCLRGLSPGKYWIIAGGEDFPLVRISGVGVETGRIEELQIVIPPFGRARFLFRGFGDGEKVSCQLRYLEVLNKSWDGFDSDSASRNKVVPLLAGKWELSSELEGYGVIQQRFEVKKDILEEVVVDRGFFDPPESPLHLKGKITFSDGTPATQGIVEFNGFKIPALKGQEKRIREKTDSTGSFEVDEIYPGRWRVSYLARRYGQLFLEDLYVPPFFSGDSVEYSAVIPMGDIEADVFLVPGVVRRLKPSHCGLWVSLKDLDSQKVLRGGCRLLALEESGLRRIRLDATPPGRYILSITALGHCEYLSDPFYVDDSRTTHLGRIVLEEADCILFVITGEFGETKGIPSPRFLSKGDADVCIEKLFPRGRFLCTGLSPGPHAVEVGGGAFETRKIQVPLGKGEGMKVVKLTLHREKFE